MSKLSRVSAPIDPGADQIIVCERRAATFSDDERGVQCCAVPLPASGLKRSGQNIEELEHKDLDGMILEVKIGKDAAK